MPIKDPEYRKEYYQKNKEKILVKQKEYYKKNKEKIKEKAIEYYEKYYKYNNEKKEKKQEYYKKYSQRPEVKERIEKYNRSKERVEKRWNKKGIKNMTVEKYNKIFKEQKGNCSICGINQNEFKIPLAVDHNHKTGQIRGLLCSNCNTSLGGFKDNINILTSSISYLQQDYSIWK